MTFLEYFSFEVDKICDCKITLNPRVAKSLFKKKTSKRSITFALRYQCTPNEHHSSAPLYGRTVDVNPTKVYIF